LDESVKRIAITGARSPLGLRLLDELERVPQVELVRGVEARAQHDSRDSHRIDIVSFAPDHRIFAEYLEKERIDTVIQCGRVPDRSGLGSSEKEADVIGTMCIGAAIGHEGSSVRNWILASSSAVYPIGSHSPLLQREGLELPREEETFAASIAEAEEYARDVAYRLPHVNVAIMRLQQLAGSTARGPLASLLSRNPVPTLMGFDAPIQFLNLRDASSAITFAARTELAGIYNVASAGLIRWRDAVRATGHSGVPVLPVNATPFEGMLQRLRVPIVPSELQDLLRFGHVVDIRKLERAGWRPQCDQVDCIRALCGSHQPPTGPKRKP